MDVDREGDLKGGEAFVVDHGPDAVIFLRTVFVFALHLTVGTLELVITFRKNIGIGTSNWGCIIIYHDISAYNNRLYYNISLEHDIKLI